MLEPATLQQQYQPYANQNDQATSKLEQNPTDPRYISCEQWVDSTIQHQHDDKQSTNDEDEIDSDDPQTTTDTDNDADPPQTISINKTPLNNNDSSIYSTSVASGASIETLKPSENLSFSASSNKSKPSSWAALFHGAAPSTTQPQSLPASTTPASASASAASKSSPKPAPTQNGKATSYHPKTNYHVYNSNGEDSRSLEGR